MSVVKQIEKLYESYKKVVDKDEKTRKVREILESLNNIVKDINIISETLDSYWDSKNGEYYVWSSDLSDNIAFMIKELSEYLDSEYSLLITSAELVDYEIKEPIRSFVEVSEFLERVKKLSETTNMEFVKWFDEKNSTIYAVSYTHLTLPTN